MVSGELGCLGVFAVKHVVQVEHKQDNELVITLYQNMEENNAMDYHLVHSHVF